MNAAAVEARTVDWLPLLRELTASVPEWGVWKNADSALAGTGDVDSAAPPHCWPVIRAAFAEWAGSQGLGPVVACPHVPDGLFLLALDRERGRVLELDVAGSQPLRGHSLFHADQLGPLMVIDPLGFRRLRPGAEGLLLLLLTGLRHGGRQNTERIASRGIVALLESDPGGVRAAARLLGSARRPVLRLADAVCAGGWSRTAALTVEARCSLLSPPSWAARARYRLGWARCPVNAVIRGGRRLPADVDAWLDEVRVGHELIG